MDIVNFENIAIFSTRKMFCVRINDNIYGPFPKTEFMYELWEKFFEQPNNQSVLKSMYKEKLMLEKSFL